MQDSRYFVIPYCKDVRLNPQTVDFVFFRYQEEILSMVLKDLPEERKTVDWKREGF